MPLGRKHPRRNRDAPTGGFGRFKERTNFFILGLAQKEVKLVIGCERTRPWCKLLNRGFV